MNLSKDPFLPAYLVTSLLKSMPRNTTWKIQCLVESFLWTVVVYFHFHLKTVFSYNIRNVLTQALFFHPPSFPLLFILKGHWKVAGSVWQSPFLSTKT